MHALSVLLDFDILAGTKAAATNQHTARHWACHNVEVPASERALPTIWACKLALHKPNPAISFWGCFNCFCLGRSINRFFHLCQKRETRWFPFKPPQEGYPSTKTQAQINSPRLQRLCLKGCPLRRWLRLRLGRLRRLQRLRRVARSRKTLNFWLVGGKHISPINQRPKMYPNRSQVVPFSGGRVWFLFSSFETSGTQPHPATKPW